MRAKQNLLFFALAALIFFSCKKDKDAFTTDKPEDYFQLQQGKYVVYQLDSTVFPNFGRDTEIHSYQEKQVVDALITDALGRPSYRVFRFLRDSAGTGPWTPAGTVMVTPVQHTLELIENNLRFIKLVAPITQDNTWKGNRFLPDEPYDPLFSFNNDFDIATWDYTYSALNETVTLNGKTYDSVLTVDGINDVINVPVTDINNYGSINYQQEKYAKGVGMIFQELIMWEYQPNTGGSGGGFKEGFGVKRTLIDHN